MPQDKMSQDKTQLAQIIIEENATPTNFHRLKCHLAKMLQDKTPPRQNDIYIINKLPLYNMKLRQKRQIDKIFVF